MNDHKAVATIFFRVIGVSNIAYSVLYWVYGIFTNLFETPSRFIVTTLWALTYFVLGFFLIVLSKRLANMVVKGLDEGMQPTPPPPPSFRPSVQH
jgi:hypothetical protein